MLSCENDARCTVFISVCLFDVFAAAIRPKVPDGKSRGSSLDEVREQVLLLRLAFDGTHVLRDHRLEVRYSRVMAVLGEMDV